MRLVPCLVLCVLLAFQTTTPCQAQDVIRIRGANTVGDRIVPILVGGWMRQIGYRQTADVRQANGTRAMSGERDGETLVVEITGSGSASGFQDLVDGNTELAMLSRAPTAEELEDGWQLGRVRSPDQEFVVALQAAVILVNPANTIESLDQAQVNDILAGRIVDWAQVGGAPGRIRLHLAVAKSGLGQLQSQLLGSGTAPGIARYPGSSAVEQAVASDPRAMGITEFGRVHRGSRALALRVAGRRIVPDRLGVMTEEYPLTRRLQFYSSQLITALGRGFAEYSVSDAGQRLLAGRGFTTLAPVALPADIPGTAVADYAALVAGAQRLSMDFHFSDEFSLFESRSAQDLPRLQAFMRRPENAARRVTLIGFSDRQSTPQLAVSLSNERADLVAQALSELGIYAAKVRGVGAALPLVEDKPKHARNMRVQVWLR